MLFRLNWRRVSYGLGVCLLLSCAVLQAEDKKKNDSPPPKPAPAKPAAQPQQRPAGAPAQPQQRTPAAQPGVTRPATGQPGPGGKPTSNVRPPSPPAGPTLRGPGNAIVKLPPRVTPLPGKPGTFAHPDGRRWEARPDGRLAHFSKPGMDARFNERGKVGYAHLARPDKSSMTIVHTVHGASRVEVVRPDHSRYVSYGPRRGFVERPMLRRPGYVSRTYVVGGRSYVSVYRSYGYHNLTYYRYVPGVYYHPAFYHWAYSPWPGPVAYSWGFGPSPWYRYYGGYFAPAESYSSPNLWLTDFILSQHLQNSYAAREESDGAPSPLQFQGASSLTPEIKMAIAEQVRAQLAAQQAQLEGSAAGARLAPAGSAAPKDELPPALDPKQRMFVVSMNLDVPVADGQICGLTPGDVLLRTGDSLIDGDKVAVSVMSSKPGDCKPETRMAILVGDLQEMHNVFQEQVHAGLKLLADNRGKNGIPEGPDPGARNVPEGQAAPDLLAEKQLLKQQQDADQAETEIQRDAELGS